MFIEVLPKELPRHLETLSQGGLLQPFYLAGGTGAALQLGHRISVDLDFFSFKAFDPHILAQNIAQKGDFTGVEISPATLHGIFEETRQKYQGIKYNKVHILKAFCYFEETEQEPLPRLLSPLAWDDVKDFFVTESQKITSQWL